jgi:hypothetical protein
MNIQMECRCGADFSASVDTALLDADEKTRVHQDMSRLATAWVNAHAACSKQDQRFVQPVETTPQISGPPWEVTCGA